MLPLTLGAHSGRAALLALALAGSALAAPDHTVRAGETLFGLAKSRGLSLDALLALNPAVRPERALLVGQRLRLPEARAARPNVAPVARPAGFSSVAWSTPLVGMITSVFSGVGGHGGLDIAAPTGTPVKAARAGVVKEARFDFKNGWGGTVVLDHGDGFTSRYSHNSALLVRAGQPVEAGQPIARVGSTGRSSGPHLDYRVYRNGVPIDPSSLR